jgi:hypothetical protein
MPTTPLLDKIVADEPGRYLTTEEQDTLLRESRYLEPRITAARDAQAHEADIVKRAVDAVLKRHDFRGRYTHGAEKCYRDVGNVYRWCAFAMLVDDRKMLEDKLLLWMRSVIQSLDFPGANESIRMTYTLLLDESRRALRPASFQLMEPFLRAALEILPADSVAF